MIIMFSVMFAASKLATVSPLSPVNAENQQVLVPSMAEKGAYDDSPYPLLTWRTFVMGALVSMGGLVFGYDTGQISGFLEMDDFKERFGERSPGSNDYTFSNVRSGLIVGLVSFIRIWSGLPC